MRKESTSLEHLNIANPCTGDEVGDYLNALLEVECDAWGASGQNINASREKIAARIASFPLGVSLATCRTGVPGFGFIDEPVGSQFAFRFHWDGNVDMLQSWDAATAEGWTNRVHVADGNTGFLVGVGVRPPFRRQLFMHDQRWKMPIRASMLLIAWTLDNLFRDGVCRVIANARIPHYHLHPNKTVNDYCALRNVDGYLVDPVLRFHERMGAHVLKPVEFSMDDPESRNGGCWVIYEKPFEG